MIIEEFTREEIEEGIIILDTDDDCPPAKSEKLTVRVAVGSETLEEERRAILSGQRQPLNAKRVSFEFEQTNQA